MSVETLNILQCNECVDQKIDTPSVMTRLGQLVLKKIVTVQKGVERQRTRHELAKLDDHMLADIGLNRADVDKEMRRHF